MNDHEREEALLGGIRALMFYMKFDAAELLFNSGQLDLERFAVRVIKDRQCCPLGNDSPMLAVRLKMIKDSL